MARIKDILASIISTGEGFEEVVSILGAVGQNSHVLAGDIFAGEMHWLTSPLDIQMMKRMQEQHVAYRRLMLRDVLPREQWNRAPELGRKAKKMLHELQMRDEINYPFALIAGDTGLLISDVDYSILMTLAREQQLQKTYPGEVRDSRMFSRSARVADPEI